MKEKYIAKCYLGDEEEEWNKCELTNQRLIVKKKKRTWEFILNQIKEISISQRKLLIPLIFGGVFTPLIMVGFFMDIFHPVFSLLLIISGIFIFYIGWLGKKMLTIELSSGRFDLSIDFPTYNLLAFIDYANQYIQEQPIEKKAVYTVIKENPGEKNFIGYINENISDQAFYLYSDMKKMIDENQVPKESIIIGIDPVIAGAEIRYQKGYNTDISKLLISESIKKTAMVNAYSIQSFPRLP